MKTRIEYVKKKLPRGYVGMNLRASKSLHIPFKHQHPTRVIVIWKGLDKKARFHTIEHEKIESYLMKNHKCSYRCAHHKALLFEKKNKYFPSLKQRHFSHGKKKTKK